MFKKAMLAFGLVLGLMLTAANVSAQCGPNEVAIVNEGPWEKIDGISYGVPCTVLGGVSMVIPPGPGTIVCVPIPAGMLALHITLIDMNTGNSTTVDNPMCGGNQMGMHMACGGTCNIIQWQDDSLTMILPD